MYILHHTRFSFLGVMFFFQWLGFVGGAGVCGGFRFKVKQGSRVKDDHDDLGPDALIQRSFSQPAGCK